MSLETQQFIKLIRRNNLIGLKKLWKSSGDKIDIHSGDKFAFIYSCKNGYLEVAKWLWEISEYKIKIHIRYKYAFIYSCKNGHFQVAKWLWIISNRTIKYNIFIEYKEQLKNVFYNDRSQMILFRRYVRSYR